MAQLIDSKIIDDSYLNEECEIDEAFVYYQAIIRANKCGIYPYTLTTSALWGKVSIARLKEILDKFRKDGKLFYMNGWIAVNGHSDNYNYSNSNHALGALKELALVPISIIDNDPAIKSISDQVIKKCIQSIVDSGKINRDAIPMPYRCHYDAISMPSQCHPNAIKHKKDAIKTEKECHPDAISPTRARTNSIKLDSIKLDSIPSSPPYPPKGRYAPDPQVWIKDPGTGQLIRNPALDGRKEGKENKQSSGKGRKEGKEGKIDVNDPNYVLEWSDALSIKNSDIERLETEFGKDIAWDAIIKASDWADGKGIKVDKDPYKFVRGFALKEASNG